MRSVLVRSLLAGSERPAVIAQLQLLFVLASADARRIEFGDSLVFLGGQSQHTRRDRKSFGLIAVQQPAISTGEHLCEFPAEVVSVLDAGVQALTAGGGVHVRGVTGDENPSLTVVLGQPDVRAEHRLPLDVAAGCACFWCVHGSAW